MELFNLFKKKEKGERKIRFVFEAKISDNIMDWANRRQLIVPQLSELYNEPLENMVFYSIRDWQSGVYVNLLTNATQQRLLVNDMKSCIEAKGYKIKNFDISQTLMRDFKQYMLIGTALVDAIVTLEYDDYIKIIKENEKIVNLGISEEERKIKELAKKSLKDKQLELYALEIMLVYSDIPFGNTGFDEREKKIRPIGQKINDFNKQVLVAYRAHYLGIDKGVEVSTREIEHFWDGIGGWRK